MTVSDEGEFKPVKSRKNHRSKRVPGKGGAEAKEGRKEWRNDWAKESWKKSWNNRPWTRFEKSNAQSAPKDSGGAPVLMLDTEKMKGGGQIKKSAANVWATPSPKGGMMSKVEAEEFNKAVEASLAEMNPDTFAAQSSDINKTLKKDEVQLPWPAEGHRTKKSDPQLMGNTIDAVLEDACNCEPNRKLDCPLDEAQNSGINVPPPPPLAPPIASPTESTVSEIGRDPPPPPRFAPPLEEVPVSIDIHKAEMIEVEIQTEEANKAFMVEMETQTEAAQKDETRETSTQSDMAGQSEDSSGFPPGLLQQADLSTWSSLFTTLQVLSQHLNATISRTGGDPLVNINTIRQQSWLQQVQQQEVAAHTSTPPQTQQLPQAPGNGWSPNIGIESLPQNPLPNEYLRHHQYQQRQSYQGSNSLFAANRSQSSGQNSRGGGFRQPPPPHHHGYSAQSGFQFDTSAFSAMYNDGANPALNWNRTAGL